MNDPLPTPHTSPSFARLSHNREQESNKTEAEEEQTKLAIALAKEPEALLKLAQ